MTVSKMLQELASKSKNIRRPKEALQALFSVGYFVISQPTVFAARNPFGTLIVGKKYHELHGYDENDLARLKEIVTAYLELVAASEPFDDVLGGLYDSYLGEDLGQFFTPKDVAQLIGQLSGSMALSEESVASRTPHRINDFCCGGGSLGLGYIYQVYKKHGKEGVALLDVHAQDICPHMCRLATLQIMASSLIHGIPLHGLTVQCGNALSQDYELVLQSTSRGNAGNMETYIDLIRKMREPDLVT